MDLFPSHIGSSSWRNSKGVGLRDDVHTDIVCRVFVLCFTIQRENNCDDRLRNSAVGLFIAHVQNDSINDKGAEVSSGC